MIIDKDIVEMMRLYRIKNRLKVCKKHRNVLDQVHHEESCLVAMENYQLLKNKLIGIHGKDKLFGTVDVINKALSTPYTLSEIREDLDKLYRKELKGKTYTISVSINDNDLGVIYKSDCKLFNREWYAFKDVPTRVVRGLSLLRIENLKDNNTVTIKVCVSTPGKQYGYEITYLSVRGVLYNVCNAVYAHNPILCTP